MTEKVVQYEVMILILLILFIIGLAVGSFLNVMIYRTTVGEGFVKGRSRCDHCHKEIQWFDNIPLFSFLILRGKCRHCKKPISVQHPVIELITGLLFIWWYLGGFFLFQIFQLQGFPFSIIQPLFWLMVGILLLIIFFTDLLYMIIPDYAVASLFGLALLYRVVLVVSGIMQVSDFVFSLAGMVIAGVFFFGLWYFTKGKGMGFGDVKFALPMALLVGWPVIFITIFLSFILGSIVAIIFLLTGKKTMKQTVPFGPFLVLSTFITLVYGDRLLGWYLSLL